MFLTKTRVVIVDDSATARKAIVSALQRRSGIEVVGEAADAYEAKELILRHLPDALLLDVDMPRMDGVTFLRLLMKHHPMPVVALGYRTQHGSASAMECLDAGAVEVLTKPTRDAELYDLGDELARALKRAAGVKRETLRAIAAQSTALRSKAPPRPTLSAHSIRPQQAIFMGASTGGTEALHQILEALPEDLAPIFIVQHIPAAFSKAFAERVNKRSAIDVRHAEHGEIARPGQAFIAPGDFHMTVEWSGREHRVLLNRDPQVWHQRPAVDVLFNSASPLVASISVGVILTGMGRDGATGLLRLRQAGALTIGQDAPTSVVYGMPKAAFEIGSVMEQLPLASIPAAIVNAVQRQSQSLSARCVTNS